MRKLVKLGTLLAVPALLIGCGNTGALTVVSCEVGNYTLLRKGDKVSEATAAEMEQNNESRKAGGCPAPNPSQRVASKS